MELSKKIQQRKIEAIEKIRGVGINDNHYPADKMVRVLDCEDTDSIPKVTDAGMIFADDLGSYQLMHNGVKVIADCYNGKWMSDIIYGLQGHHEPQEEKIFYEIIKLMPKKAVMIELGSWWAYYSLWFAKEVEESRNYLIEPVCDCLEIGKKNFEMNQLNGFFTQGFIGESPNGYDCSGAQKIGIDEFLEKNQIDHVNILHSDIQCYEYSMLLSAEKSISLKKIDYFFISTHEDRIHQQCHEFLLSRNYKIIAEHSIAEGFMPDGLIVAKREDIAYPDEIPVSKVEKGRKIW